MVNVPMKKCTEFCMLYMPEVSRDELIIPSDFVREVKEGFPENVVLKDQHGNFWQVEMKKIGKLWYFKDGWRNVVKECFLEWGDLLYFEYIGRGVFKIKIFGANCCPKKLPGNTIEKTEASNARTKNTRYNDTKEQVEEEDEENDEDEDYIEDENDDVDAQGAQPIEAGTVDYQTRLKKPGITEWLAKDVFDSGLAAEPKNPYFVTRLMKSRRDELFIPAFIYKFHDLELPGTIALLSTQNGKTYSLTRKIWKGGRINLIGWKNVCEEHSVGPEDRCICEFIGEDAKLKIRFSVIRPNGEK